MQLSNVFAFALYALVNMLYCITKPVKMMKMIVGKVTSLLKRQRGVTRYYRKLLLFFVLCGQRDTSFHEPTDQTSLYPRRKPNKREIACL